MSHYNRLLSEIKFVEEEYEFKGDILGEKLLVWQQKRRPKFSSQLTHEMADSLLLPLLYNKHN